VKTLFSILFVILPIAVVAQMGKVVGKVRDSKGEPLIGASVINKMEITCSKYRLEKVCLSADTQV
jgi:hypothetical protein